MNKMYNLTSLSRSAMIIQRSCLRPSFRSFCASSKQEDLPEEEELRKGGHTQIHFRATPTRHPLWGGKASGKDEKKKGPEWRNPSANHVWTREEVDDIMNNPIHHQPTKIRHWLAYGIIRGSYHIFNKLTGYKRADPTPRSVEYRLILLESVAGVPGMVAAGMRHFRSLRKLERDHGWIHTLLEEAENERMHLLTCLKMFEATRLARIGVVLFQAAMVPALSIVYIIHPKTMHRLVGYIEETAVHTYTGSPGPGVIQGFSPDIIRGVEKEGTQLNKAWGHLKAPNIAISYWRMDQDAMWIDVLRQICADESHHRDVNHSFASMESDDPNPHLEGNIKDARALWTSIDSTRDAPPSHLSSKPFWSDHCDSKKASP